MDVVIWDEASMSSPRMLELVNALHHNLADQENYELPTLSRETTHNPRRTPTAAASTEYLRFPGILSLNLGG